VAARANATLGYYAKGTVWDRLAKDVIQPSIARGYSQVWLAGISIGGLGAFLYARQHPEGITGLVGMAPFLGEAPMIHAIEAAGGLSRWQPPPREERITEDNYQPQVWRWLKEVTGQPARGPALYLGFGGADRLAPAARLLAAELPPAHVFETGGGHD
jgi:pimeloyl-ACP methyl ester carboxylesterase